MSGHHKASVVVKPSPMLYHFPQTTKESSDKENQDHFKTRFNTNLPYRSIFAVLTIDTVYIYDTFQLEPLCIVKGLHYAGLTDATWTDDGLNLIITSSDGYLSILSFEEGELGNVYEKLEKLNMPAKKEVSSPVLNNSPTRFVPTTLPPCALGESTEVEVPSAKRMKMISPPSSSIDLVAVNEQLEKSFIGHSKAEIVPETCDSTAIEIPCAKRVKMASSPVSSVILIDKNAPPIGKKMKIVLRIFHLSCITHLFNY